MILINNKVLSINMCVFYLFITVSLCFVAIFVLIIMVKSLHEKVDEMSSADKMFYVGDREFKSSSTHTATRVFNFMNSLEDSFKLRTNLILDRLDDFKRSAIKKEEFERLFELLRREKILLENATDEATKKIQKGKWDMWESALGGTKDKKDKTE